MSLPENRFKIASEKIQDEHVSEQMPRAVVQKHRGDKLPGISVADAAITQAKIIADESRLIEFDTQLRDKDRQVRADQGQQDEALALRPTLRVGRRFPARQTHFARVSQRN
jgi:hypothetical protein